ncbi:MAG: restriction endonuclease subunit S [Acinetobacter sp.]
MFKKYDAYKDSDVQWIGEIPTSWFNDRLGTILEPISKKGNADKPLLSITREKGVILRDVEDDSENHNFIPDDLSNYKLIEKGQFGMNKMKAWQGSYGVSSHTGIVSPAYYVFKFIKPIYPEFFHWAIRSKTYISFFGSASDGVRIGQWDLSKDRMKNIPFVFPDVDSQKKIVEFIQDKAEQIDQAIAIKEQQIALLNERKQIVIQKAVTQGLNPNVAMKDSGVEWIGQIPEHWKISRIKHLGKILNGFAFPSDSFTDQGVRVLKISNIQTMTLDWQDESYIDEKWKKIATNALVYKGDLVFALTRPIISTGLKATIIDSDETMLLNQRNAVLRPNNKVIKEWLYYVLLADGFVQEFEKKIDITGQQPNISTVSIGNLPLVYPTLDEQVQICETLERICQIIDEAINVEKKSIHQLKEYKTTLINDAVTGKIKVA